MTEGLNTPRPSDTIMTPYFMGIRSFLVNLSIPDRPVQSKLSSYHLFGPELGIVCDPIIAHDHARSNMHHPHGVEWRCLYCDALGQVTGSARIIIRVCHLSGRFIKDEERGRQRERASKDKSIK